MITWVPPKISNISLQYTHKLVSICQVSGCHGNSHLLWTDWRTHDRWVVHNLCFSRYMGLFLQHVLKSWLDIFFGMQCVYAGFRCFWNDRTVLSLEVLDVHLQKRVCQAFVKQLEARCAGIVKHCENPLRVVLIFSDACAACAGLHLVDQSIDVQGNAATCHVSILLMMRTARWQG